MRPIARAALAGVLLLADCGSPVVPSLPQFATSVTQAFDGTAMVFSVSPWPLDGTVAFLCRRSPGAEFTIENPKPAEQAGCVPLEVSTNGDVLRARFDSSSLAPELAEQFDVSGAPWFLAVSGARGPFSAATVLTVINSPIFSPPGPS